MPDKNTLQELYFAKRLPASAIANMYGVGRTTVTRWFERYDIKLRPKGLPSELRPSGEELRRLYIDERLSSPELALMFGCTFCTVCRWLNESGIEVRSTSEAASLRMSKRTHEEKLRNSEVSRSTSAFKTQTHERRCKIAASRQLRPRMSKYESELFNALIDANIQTVPQYAIDKYNIDFAIPEIKLAIEVDGGNWHSTSIMKREQDAHKKAYLDSIGWTLLRIKTRRPDWVQLATVAISLCSK